MDDSPYLSAGEIDWSAVGRATFEVRQMLRYEYPGPIEDVRQLLVLVPADRMGSQRLLAHNVAVSPAARPRFSGDRFGNRLCNIALTRVQEQLEFTVTLRVERELEAGFPLRDGERDLYTVPSPLTEPSEALRAMAESLRAGAAGPLELAERICAWVHERIAYTQGVTGVLTTAQDAFEQRRGVCQDYAHLMIALCRLAGLAARYVSGHLLGEGAMHAWVQVLPAFARPDGSLSGEEPHWLPFDPTHNRRAGITYITVAIGRDYGDVSPTRGSFRAPYGGRLSGGYKHAGVLSVEPRAG